jgi:protein-disulfide isomerase
MAGLLTMLAVVALAACRDADAGAQESTSVASTADAPAPAASGDTLSDSALFARADAGRLMGRDSGTMWVVMVSDFQCPYCKMWHDTSFVALERDYVKTGKVRLAYFNFPLEQHPYAHAEAEAALCAGVQGKFWEYSDGLFERQSAIARMPTIEPTLDRLARANALDLTGFAHCRKSKAIAQLIASDMAQAQRSNIRSTPSFLVGNFLVEGAIPYADFRHAIDTALFVARAARKGTR